jgi:hypothetical protein
MLVGMYGVPGRARAIGENTRKCDPHHRRLNNHEKYPAYNGSCQSLEVALLPCQCQINRLEAEKPNHYHELTIE